MERLDRKFCKLFPEISRNRAQRLIRAGQVLVGGSPVVRPGVEVADESLLELLEDERFVSFAGRKLDVALKSFRVGVRGTAVLDVGTSTGGFADCLLQNGASKVYGVDVGTGQLDKKLANNADLVSMDGIDIRDVASLPELVDLVTVDVSFIAVAKIAESIFKFLKSKASCVILIKPQFELEKGEVPKNGVVVDQKLHDQTIKSVCSIFEEAGFRCEGVVDAPRKDSRKNQEFLGYFTKNF
ncbi:TlyA family RNA methyltransferase [bacterium]|nr:TlyA family RNA methyltransferase [bacterium]